MAQMGSGPRVVHLHELLPSAVLILTNTTLSLLHTFYMKKFDKGAKLVMVTPPPASAKKDKEVVDAEAEEVDDDADEPEEPKGTKAAPASAQKSPASRRKRRRKH